jgi:hypothetical protein
MFPVLAIYRFFVTIQFKHLFSIKLQIIVKMIILLEKIDKRIYAHEK